MCSHVSNVDCVSFVFVSWPAAGNRRWSLTKKPSDPEIEYKLHTARLISFSGNEKYSIVSSLLSI